MYEVYYAPYWLNDDELEHFGIKGMKWGIRRYQNPDGTLTEAGKQRYGSIETLEAAKAKREYTKKVFKTAATATAGVVVTQAAIALGAGTIGVLAARGLMKSGLLEKGFKELAKTGMKTINEISKTMDDVAYDVGFLKVDTLANSINSTARDYFDLSDLEKSKYAQQKLKQMMAELEAAR